MNFQFIAKITLTFAAVSARSGGGSDSSTEFPADSLAPPTSCPITTSTNFIYSKASGVGGASMIWVQDLLAWWKLSDSNVNYLGLTASEIQSCDLASFTNLKVYINPGGDAYSQLTSLGTAGAKNIKAFVQRDQSKTPSAYVGFCAGGYLAAHDYLWEVGCT